MKRGLLVFAIFLLVITSVSALQISHENTQPEALPGGSVNYLLHLMNNEDSTLYLTFKSPDLNWLLDQEGQKLILGPGDSEDYIVSFKPLSGNRILPGNYAVRLLINTQLTPIEKLLTATVLDYDQVFDAEFVGSSVIDPKRGSIIKLKLINDHLIGFTGLKFELNSPQFSFTKTIDLGKATEKVLEYPIKVDPDTLKGDYNATVKLTYGNHLMLNKNLVYSIQEYQELKELTVPETGFLLSGETVTYSNAGNTPVQQTVTRVFGWFSYKFSSFNPEPTSVENTDEGYVAKWDLNVLPQTAATVGYVVNYRLPIFILVLIIIALFIWYIIRQRNAVVVVKRVFAMHTETGSVQVMKVLINIRNRGGMSINNVRLVDRVPSTIKAPTQHGMPSPTHVKAAPDGTVMVWDIPVLRAGEEKIISYRIEGKIHLLGRVALPAAIAKYVLFGRGVTARSTHVSLQEKK